MEYGIRIAEIVGMATAKAGNPDKPQDSPNFRIKIRVTPEMDSIDEDYLPIWPCFFKYQGITGKVGDLVWVLCNEEFTIGYILGFMNPYTWSGSYINDSIPKTVFNAVDSMHVALRGRLLNYKDIIVTYWDQQSLHFVERSTGASVIALTSGVLHIVRPGEILMAVMNSDSTSMIKIDANETVITSKAIRLQGTVYLGDSPQGNVLVTSGPTGKNGRPSDNVWA